jgi:hypothetical protein
MFEEFPPVTRLRMLVVRAPLSFRKFAVLFVPTLKLPKLWNKLVPFLAPPVMS